jgi:predicted dehydrogenase
MRKMAKEIRVGIVGGNANAGWTKLSHVPAIKALPSADTEMVYWRETAHQLRSCGLSAAAE